MLIRLRVVVAENHDWVLTVIALGAILAGAGLYLAGRNPLADAVLAGAVTVQSVSVLIHLARALIRERRFGVDVIALLAMVGALALGQYLAGAVIALMFSGRVGANNAAELGTMRVNEEIDALDVMGMPTVRYVVTSRVIAALVIMPFMYFLALASSFIASWAVQHYQVALISDGAYFDYFWRFLNVQDLIFSMIKAISFAFLIILVAIYYGFHVTGGAVGIGRAVAKTMAVSLVMTVLVNAFMTQLFWGVNANLPIQGG